MCRVEKRCSPEDGRGRVIRRALFIHYESILGDADPRTLLGANDRKSKAGSSHQLRLHVQPDILVQERSVMGNSRGAECKVSLNEREPLQLAARRRVARSSSSGATVAAIAHQVAERGPGPSESSTRLARLLADDVRAAQRLRAAVDRTLLWRVAAGVRRPSLQVAVDLQRLTGGRVSCAGWFRRSRGRRPRRST